MYVCDGKHRPERVNFISNKHNNEISLFRLEYRDQTWFFIH